MPAYGAAGRLPRPVTLARMAAREYREIFLSLAGGARDYATGLARLPVAQRGE